MSVSGKGSMGSKGWRLLLLVLCAIIVASAAGTKNDGIIRETLQRSKKDPVKQLAIRQRPLTSKERRRLAKKIRKVKSEDIQVVIGDNVDSDYSPAEMATKLVNTWQENGSMTERGILILLTMEQNSLEIQFGQGLAHLLDQEWCQELAYTKMVPWFRKGDYAKGLEEAVLEISKTLRALQGGSKRKGRRKWIAAMAASFGAWKYRRRLRRWALARHILGDNPPPPPPLPSPTTPHFGSPRLLRRRWKRKGRSKSPKVSPRGGSSSWFGLDDLLSMLFSSSTSGTTGHGSCYSKTPSVTNVNVFIPPERQATSPRVELQEPVAHSTVTGDRTTAHQEPPLTKRAEPTPVKAPDTKSPPPLQKTAFWSKPEPFRPMDRLSKKQDKPKSSVAKPSPPPSSSSSRHGGGASWSTVKDRAAPDTKSLSPRSQETTKATTAKSNARHGGGARWSEPSKSAKKVDRANDGNKKRLGGGASWTSTDTKSKPGNNSKGDNKSSRNGGGATW